MNMDKPLTGRQDYDDVDFEEDEELDDDCECGEWKPSHRDTCDSCRFVNQ